MAGAGAARAGRAAPKSARPARSGGRLTGFVDRHLVAWELSMAALSVVYAALGFFMDSGRRGAPEALVVALSLLFLLEFSARFLDAPSRIAYLRTHWLDLVTCIPAAGPLRALRLVRLLSLVRVIGVMRRVALDQMPSWTGSWILAPAAILLWLSSAEAFWILERGHNPDIRSFGDALYLAFMTVTTVGYGDVRPITPEGKVVAGLLVFTGLGMLGLLSSRLTLALTREEDHVPQMRRELRELHREVARLAQLVERLAAVSAAPPEPPA